ncbi:MAG: magnesium transporter [Fibrobacterota bacterium]
MSETAYKNSIEELFENHQYSQINEYCRGKHPAEIADMLASLEPRKIWEILLLIKSDLRVEIFGYFPLDTQIEITESLNRKALSQIFTDLPADDRADLFKELSEETQNLLLPALAQAERDDVIRLSSYDEGTAGSVMTSEYVALLAHDTVDQALGKLRLQAPNKETIYYAYILDTHRRLMGFVSLKDIILAAPRARVKDIMSHDLVYCHVMDDQEKVARKIQKYDLLALPVVDDKDCLLGIITHDDALDIITQEQTEDIEKLMAISGQHEARAYLKKSIWTHFTDRIGWLVGLAVLSLASGVIIHHFEATLDQLMILALYMPMMADTGGNTGSQSATIIIRALALNEVRTRDFMRVVFKELRISLLLATVLGVLTWGRVHFLSHNVAIPESFSLHIIGFAIALGLAIQVISSTVIGALLPLTASKLKLDPAVVASPALTTTVDITGLLIYFTTAKAVLGI